MKCSLKILAIIFFTSLLFLNACGGRNANSNSQNSTNRTGNANDNANIAKDDFRELGKIINLPFEPDESTVWREADLTSQKKLVAVLKFTPEQTLEIIKNAEKYKPSVPAALDAESWFPEELTAQSQETGDQTLKGNSYAANDFVKAPYTDGKITRIVNSDYFVLELTSF